MKLTLKIQTYPDQPLCRVWLTHPIGGGANSSLMHGTMTIEQADDLAAVLGVPVLKVASGLGFAANDKTLAAESARQRELFTGGK